MKKLSRYSCGLVLALLSCQVAAWNIDRERSQISYLSSKLVVQSYQSIVENNFFASFSGSVSADGKLQLVIDADSVKTGVEIRDQRVHLHAFDSKNHPQIILTAALNRNLDAIKVGEIQVHELSGTLMMRGVSNPVSAQVVVVRATDNSLLVQTLSPVVINAADYKMAEAFEQLKGMVGLFNIPQLIPVSVQLVLTK